MATPINLTINTVNGDAITEYIVTVSIAANNYLTETPVLAVVKMPSGTGTQIQALRETTPATNTDPFEFTQTLTFETDDDTLTVNDFIGTAYYEFD